EKAIPELIQAFQEENKTLKFDVAKTLKINIAKTLGEIGPKAKEAIPILIQNIENKNTFVSIEVAKALLKIDNNIRTQLGTKIRTFNNIFIRRLEYNKNIYNDETDGNFEELMVTLLSYILILILVNYWFEVKIQNLAIWIRKRINPSFKPNTDKLKKRIKLLRKCITLFLIGFLPVPILNTFEYCRPLLDNDYIIIDLLKQIAKFSLALSFPFILFYCFGLLFLFFHEASLKTFFSRRKNNHKIAHPENNQKLNHLAKKIFKFFLVLYLVGLVVAIVLGYLNYQRSQRVAQILKEYKKSGYATSLQEINTKYPLPLVNENGAILIESAISKLKDPEQKEGDIINSQYYTLMQSIAPGESLSEETKMAIGNQLVQNEEALRMLRQGIAMNRFRYCPDYTLGVKTKFPNVIEMRKMNNLLMLKTLFHLKNGELEEAIHSVLDGFRLSRSLSNDPAVIPYMIQTALIQVNVESLEHLVNRTTLSEKNILDLSSLLQVLEEPTSLGRSFITDAVTFLEIFNQDAYLYGGNKFAYFSGLAENDKIFYMETMKRLIDSHYAPLHERMKRIQSLLTLEKEIQDSSDFLYSVTKKLIPGLFRAGYKELEKIMMLRNAQIALAVERYRLANQKLPEQLSELAPTYIKEELLLDLFDNKLVRYKKLSKGYLIYSVGQDAKDNGGKKKEKEEAYDLVFTVNR
ncbi:MAG: HEAT repeat domain-containing protein, partial [Planctomycetota bacterium]